MADVDTIPEQVPVTMALVPATDAAGRTSSYFSVRNAAKCYFIVNIIQGNAATVGLTVVQATAAAGTGSKAIAGTHRIWATQDVATAATVMPTRQTDASSFTTSATLANKVVVIEVDPATNLDVAGGFCYVAIVTGASNVANLTQASVQFVGPRYAQAAFPSPRV